ncbi:MAG TPA: hypothetical protein VFN02_05790, partial [Ktedonobacteraceae bacterium]|nr:hypothetical protein [Ktedonobacteraceae bacterium]
EGKQHLLVVNFTAWQRRVVIGPLPAGRVTLRSLDVQSVQEAIWDPGSFRQRREQVEVTGGELTLDLAPYATVRLDV